MLNGEPDPKYANKSLAFACVKEKVRQQLKSPSTAEFQHNIDMQIETTDNLSYKIGGYVDSQNSFGAMLRTNFVCSLTVKPETQSCLTNCEFPQ